MAEPEPPKPDPPQPVEPAPEPPKPEPSQAAHDQTEQGGALVVVAHDRFWLLAGALSGFMVIAPVLATSLYALSRAMERGEPASLALVARTWLSWQRSHLDKWGHDYWCMVQFGALLALAATGWVVTSAALITADHWAAKQLQKEAA